MKFFHLPHGQSVTGSQSLNGAITGFFSTYLAGATALVGLAAVALPIAPAIAAKDSRHDFNRCAAALVNLKLSSEESVAACSRALQPEYLGKCVTRVSAIGYTPLDALNACREVRRPEEMAACVVDIRQSLSASTAADVLDSCRRSLLPMRYANCVIGISRGGAGLAPASALNSCIDIQEFPREVDPTFIRYTESQPAVTAPEPVQPAPTQPAPVAPSTGPVRGLF